MASCQQIRPFLYRTVEGEASPDETMRVARHLPDCTACKILLAREQRLAEWLEQGMEDLPVEGRFVDEVMANLPESPPPLTNPRNRRGLKLAGLAGLIAVPAFALSRIAWSGGSANTATTLPSPNLETAEGLAAALLGLIRLTVSLLESVAGNLPLDLSAALPGFGWIAGAAGAAMIGLAGLSSLLAVGAGSLVKTLR